MEKKVLAKWPNGEKNEMNWKKWTSSCLIKKQIASVPKKQDKNIWREKSIFRYGKLVFSPGPEGLLQVGSASIASMYTRFHTHYVLTCRWKSTYSALKWICTCMYSAGLLRSATFHGCFIALNKVIFFGLFNFNTDTASSNVLESKVRGCFNEK